MAEQKMVLEIAGLAELVKAVRELVRMTGGGPVQQYVAGEGDAGYVRERLGVWPSRWRPITIDSPEGVRKLYVDEVGESHWVLPRAEVTATERGWRQAWTAQ